MNDNDLPELPIADLHTWPAFKEETVRAIQREAFKAGMVRAAGICMEQATEPECPERAEYCADAIIAATKGE